ncbi:RNA polymerase sigma-70 factor [Flavivirga algicola]|uniref:RNA polymerase sigma-70 factor n=1 Tax=Flavivirga algicola TaxID=2729136 RepID=A0ABX1RTG7_9FLAO|nr:RNA polymerase sigma-70 factor [Flavivirga algicola]NMH86849.1 RNA polymerase sigma-70 factor [Flavivirga algicola]
MCENELYRRIQNDSEDAFKDLFDRYYERLSNFALQFSISKETAEELVSDVFVKLWNKRKETVILNLRPFLYVSVKNASINALKSDKIQFKDTFNDKLFSIVDVTTQEHKMIVQEQLDLVQRTIDKMPQHRKIIFMLNRIDGLRYKEIAEVLNISPNTVQNQMVEAIKFLHKEYPNKKKSV